MDIKIVITVCHVSRRKIEYVVHLKNIQNCKYKVDVEKNTRDGNNGRLDIPETRLANVKTQQ